MRAEVATDRVARARKTAQVSSGLAYHEIWDGPSKYLYSVSAAQFLTHVQCVKETMSAGSLQDTSRHITFDDGHISQHIHALPILQNVGVKATFFITVGWTDNRDGYMSWREIAELISCGHEVQSHGWSHQFLTKCSAQTLKEELVRSKTELEDRLGVHVNAISAPGGRWDEKVLASCAEAGYKRVFTSDPWMTPRAHFGLEVCGRWMVTRDMTPLDIRARLLGKGAKLYFLRADHIAKSLAKKLLGDQRYQTMWRALASKDKSMETLEDQALLKPRMKT